MGSLCSRCLRLNPRVSGSDVSQPFPHLGEPFLGKPTKKLLRADADKSVTRHHQSFPNSRGSLSQGLEFSGGHLLEIGVAGRGDMKHAHLVSPQLMNTFHFTGQELLAHELIERLMEK